MEEQQLRVPPASKIGSSLRAALGAFPANAVRLVIANSLWGVVFAAAVLLMIVIPFIGVFVFLLLLPLPTAGLFRMATLIARGRPAALSDALGWRSMFRISTYAGMLLGSIFLVLGVSAFSGFSSLSPLGWALATIAAWGLLATWFVALTAWPLLLDPLRTDEPMSGLLKLAVTVILVRPLRYIGLQIVLGIVLIVSALLVVPLLMLTVAFTALVMSFYTLPIADRIEGRRTFVVTS